MQLEKESEAGGVCLGRHACATRQQQEQERIWGREDNVESKSSRASANGNSGKVANEIDVRIDRASLHWITY